jgi:two-component system, LytTR family, response regulator
MVIRRQNRFLFLPLFYISANKTMATKDVLIIDDEEASRTIIRQYLEDHPGMMIIGECRNGVEAITAIDRIKPDLVFLDIQMPGFSGFQVLQHIAHIPLIIFSTAYDQYAMKVFETTAVDYLLKPYTRERFSQAVSKVMQHGNPPGSIQSLAQHHDYGKMQAENGPRLIC